MAANPKKPVQVWDLPVRLFHWGLAATILGSFITIELGEMDAHAFCGFLALSLVIFRVIWGLIGSETARFRDFLRGPGGIIAYLRDGRSGTLGHNPLGGLSVIALLAVVLAQAGTGLFANDDIFFDGPWAGVVGKDTSDWLTGLHHRNQNILLGLILLHLCAIGYHTAKSEKLVGPMITGTREVDAETPEPEMRPLIPALLSFAAAMAISAAVLRYWIL